jgi:NADPH:quinone reductase-like Zn-dependent oxidoreductase
MIMRRRHFLISALAATTARAFAGRADAAALATTRMQVYEVGDRQTGITLRRVERPVPVPGAGEVLLRVHATGLNARDLSLMRGFHIFGGARDPATRIPLDDNACEVLSTGAGVEGFHPGDRVMVTHFPLWIDGPWDDARMSGIDFSVNRDGFLAEQVVVPAQGLVRIPEGMSYEDASTLPNAGLTAWHAVVVDAQVRPGETVLTLGTGGVSMFGMQWARMLGARVAVTSSSDEKLARVRALGAEMTVNYRSQPDWHEAILAQTHGRGVDVILNTVGISEMDRCIRACASNGRIMLIGSNSVAPAGTTAEPEGLKSFPRNMIMHGLTIQGVIVGSRRMLEDLAQAVVTNGLRPVIDRVFPFDQATEAVRYLESGAKVGKIVIRVS